jgi:DNA-binding HxlR family transcriptional regulator
MAIVFSSRKCAEQAPDGEYDKQCADSDFHTPSFPSLFGEIEDIIKIATIFNVVTCEINVNPDNSVVMARSYEQTNCPVARTLDIIGERWSILILRDLFLKGPRRFQDFQESLTGVAPNTLSARLKGMEKQGLIARHLYSEHPPRLEYHLTKKGESLGPILKALRDWGQRHG